MGAQLHDLGLTDLGFHGHCGAVLLLDALQWEMAGEGTPAAEGALYF